MVSQVGDLVHYVLPLGPRRGECRAALVTRQIDLRGRDASLMVFAEPQDEVPVSDGGCVLFTSARHDAAFEKVGGWHHRDDCPTCALCGISG
jgi:hypothetical protein